MTSNEVDMSSLQADGVAECYLCLGGDDVDTGQPLRRDCACRGTDAGFVHLSCLVVFAATISKAWDGRDMYEFTKPWRVCPGCHQEYQNEFAVDIASAFVTFNRSQYPRDTHKQVETLNLKLNAFNSMFRRLQHRQKSEAGVTANVLLSLIDRMKGEVSPLTMRYSFFAANAYGVQGQIAFDEGTEESARRAVVQFDNQLEAFRAIDNNDGIAAANSNIVRAKSKYEGDSIEEEVLEASRVFYEACVANNGEEHEQTISAGNNYALRLLINNHREKASELLTKLLATSKQVLGPHHNITKRIESSVVYL